MFLTAPSPSPSFPVPCPVPHLQAGGRLLILTLPQSAALGLPPSPSPVTTCHVFAPYQEGAGRKKENLPFLHCLPPNMPLFTLLT